MCLGMVSKKIKFVEFSTNGLVIGKKYKRK